MEYKSHKLLSGPLASAILVTSFVVCFGRTLSSMAIAGDGVDRYVGPLDIELARFMGSLLWGVIGFLAGAAIMSKEKVLAITALLALIIEIVTTIIIFKSKV